MEEFLARAGKHGLKASLPATNPPPPREKTRTITRVREIIEPEETGKANDHNGNLESALIRQALPSDDQNLCKAQQWENSGPRLFNPYEIPFVSSTTSRARSRRSRKNGRKTRTINQKQLMQSQEIGQTNCRIEGAWMRQKLGRPCSPYEIQELQNTYHQLFNLGQPPLCLYSVLQARTPICHVQQSDVSYPVQREALEGYNAVDGVITDLGVFADSFSDIRISEPTEYGYVDLKPTDDLNADLDDIAGLYGEIAHLVGNRGSLLAGEKEPAFQGFAGNRPNASTDRGKGKLWGPNGMDTKAHKFKHQRRTAHEEILNSNSAVFRPKERDQVAQEDTPNPEADFTQQSDTAAKAGTQKMLDRDFYPRVTSGIVKHRNRGPQDTKVGFGPTDLNGSEVVITIGGYEYTAKLQLQGKK